MTSKSKLSLRIDDVMCIACRGILIKPVTMPCKHSLCLECFDRTIECNTLTCPYCRKRMGSWVRAATKGKKLINESFWAEIQAKFPVQIEKKLKGEDDGVEDSIINQEGATRRIKLSQPGELLEEFRSLSRQVEEELRREREKEEQASLELIKKLQEQENEKEAARRHELEMLAKRDEELAKKLLSVEKEETPAAVNKSTASSGNEIFTPKAGSSSSGKKPKTMTGPLDIFVRSKDEITPVSGSSKEDYNQFRPIKPSPLTPTKSTPPRQIVIPQKVKPLTCRSFFGESSSEFASSPPSPPKPTLLNSSFSSERCAFAAISAARAKEQLSEDITAANNSLTNLSVESDNSETDFEDDSNDSSKWKSGESSVKTSREEKSVPKASSAQSASRNKSKNVLELKELEDDIVRSYCKLSESYDSNHLVNSKENELGTSNKVDNQSNCYPFSSQNSNQLYAYLEEQVLEDYKLALKLQEELDKENVANKRLERNYELRKRPPVDLSPEKQPNKKQRLSKTSGMVSKQRTIEEAFQLKSSQ